ncbi:hypothetical protein BDV28DRAFT_134969 [Aspergillus coremiiformis]|uniref:Protein kinase domain-containing protein n=1 Tax=Aspergillus coremiiformis TaxID=138285 RepID=A0A5N6Z4I0_9EURO|nr:hypothetical protein BDV28DRAFT_134969 [Aspergillus coremiiformis]
MASSTSPSKQELLALLNQATERANQATERAEQAENRNRNTTFAEYLEACHRLITKPLTIQTNVALTTKGSITNPTGRICPDFLRPFDFRQTQQEVFDEIYKAFHSPPSPLRTFPPFIVLEDRGKQACDRPLASEADLARHQEAEVERPVKEIIEKLLQVPEDRRPFPLHEGIMFENHSNTITENPDQITTTQPSTDPKLSKPSRPPADRNCVYSTGDNRSLLYIIEYKAAHKLTDAFIRAGLRPMNMLEEVVHRITIPTNTDEKHRYDAAYLSCAAVTQTYEYMMKAGLEWGSVVNGHMKVILRIPEDEPKTLEYDILDPSKDAEPNPVDGLGFRFPYTAIGYQLGLTIAALRSPQRSQAWRNEVIRGLSKWEIDFELALKSIPESERKASPPGSEYRAPVYPIDNRSPYLLRRRLVLGSPPPNQPRKSPSPDSSGESDTGQKHLLSSPIEDRSKRQRTSNHSSDRHRAPGSSPNYKFCTQMCLRGLLSQSELDDKCPNVHFHQRCSNSGRHPISHHTLLELFSHQLYQNLDSCSPIGKEGLHGSLFAIQLQTYGYTLIGKGTEYQSRHEGTIYRKLKALQGLAVPVYLGDIDLRNVYYTDSGREIIHISLMAWGGDALQENNCARLQHCIDRTNAEIRNAGVFHLDLRPPNFLWNEEMQRVMFIDFGRATTRQKRKASVDPSEKNAKSSPFAKQFKITHPTASGF